MRYFIVLDKERNTLWGTMGKGVYEVEGPESNPQAFTYTEGIHIEIEIPKDEVLDYYKKDINLMKTHIQRAVHAESKLVAAGKEIVQERENHIHEIQIIKSDLVGICSRNNIELGSTKGMIQRIGKSIDDSVANWLASEKKLNGITEILNNIDKEQGGFEVNPEYPIGSMDTIRHVLLNWRKEIIRLNEEVFQRDKEHSEVMDYLKEFLSGLGYETKGWADTEIADTLEDVLRDMKPINQPVKVPADVAESLDLLYAETGGNGDWAHSAVMFYSYTTLKTEPFMFNPLYIPHLSKVSLWRLGHMDLFPDLMKYGYVADISKKEKWVQDITNMFNDKTINHKAFLEAMYDQYNVEEILDKSKGDANVHLDS
jgi:hypothetical protein